MILKIKNSIHYLNLRPKSAVPLCHMSNGHLRHSLGINKPFSLLLSSLRPSLLLLLLLSSLSTEEPYYTPSTDMAMAAALLADSVIFPISYAMFWTYEALKLACSPASTLLKLTWDPELSMSASTVVLYRLFCLYLSLCLSLSAALRFLSAAYLARSSFTRLCIEQANHTIKANIDSPSATHSVTYQALCSFSQSDGSGHLV